MAGGGLRRAKARAGGGPCWVLPALAVALAAAGAASQRLFSLPHARISNLAVTEKGVLVAGGPCVYQLQTTLAPAFAAGAQLFCVNRSDAVNKLLLPYAEEEGGRLLTCWTQPDGICYRSNLSGPYPNGTMPPENKVRLQSVTSSPRGSSVGKMFYRSPHWYLAAATTSWKEGTANSTSEEINVLYIVRENEPWVGEDNSWQLPESFYFVDVFLWGGHLFFPFYQFNIGPKMVIVPQAHPRLQFSQTALQCGQKTRILSSSQLSLSEGRAFWIGIFTSNDWQRTPQTTALCLFDLKQVLKDATACQFESFKEFHNCDSKTEPVNKSPFLNHSNLASVYATVIQKTPVLFLGTGNGQLLKVTLDEKMTPSCPDILYEIEEETEVFYKLEFDPLDKNFIYLPSTKELRRVQVANCTKYISCKECLSAMDPYCGWCHLNKRCTLKEECSNNSRIWVDISEGVDKCLKIHVSGTYRGGITVTSVGNFSGLSERNSSCKVINTETNKTLCENKSLDIMNCSCYLHSEAITGNFQVLLTSGSQNLSEVFEFNHCSLQKTCSECGDSGCTWNAREQICVSSDGTCKQKIACPVLVNASDDKYSAQILQPMNITLIEPMWISTLGKNALVARGRNFTASNILMEISGTSSCKPDIIPVTEVVNDTLMKFCLPPSRKEAKSICIKADEFKCSPPVLLYYVSLPACSKIFPNRSWLSGGRKTTIDGRNLNVTDNVIILDDHRQPLQNFSCTSMCHFQSPAFASKEQTEFIYLELEVEKKRINCGTLQYDPDPKFIHYELTTNIEPELELKIYKQNDKLNISVNEIDVVMNYNSSMNITFTVQNITTTERYSTIYSKAELEKNLFNGKVDTSIVKVWVKVGNRNHLIPSEPPNNNSYLYILLFIPVVIGVAVFVTQRKSMQLKRKLSEHLELLECELRKEIRDGFAELQMEKIDVVDPFETIPFLDYTHFVLRAFFPESDNLASLFIEDTDQPLSRNLHRKDTSITALFALICNKNFLVTLIHTLEKQKTFSVKDRCQFASFLTIALQTNLVYLTHILEVLMRDLMEQSGNIQPKLLLRRTESIVEKLLTNWMSVCLSAFLRETVGEPFYLLVTTLNQRIIKGPVDVITCKALYTLNEDWLLWQVTEFSTVALNVVFENPLESDGEDTTQNIQVNVLDCDTIGQAKEKILHTFRNKNGSLYDIQLNEMGLVLQSDTQAKELLDVDASSVILENGITKLNTIGHYEILDGTAVKVFKRTHILPDVEYSCENYCHLILPNSEAAKDAHSAKHKGKQRFKVKEMYLTKLLSTKVTIHSVVEELFRSIWTLPSNKAPIAVKYFFDFLDAQAENKKITDPDVVHIWKTNSLPLRFWVNILKNPQFVFDIKKTPHIDGCLSVIAQAFMDAFSLSEQQLGKEAPTNKLLYAKDIPLYKEEVKAFYKAVRELPSLPTSELEEFLTQESEKHENEFKEAAALTKIYRYIEKYFDEILNKLEKEQGLEEVQNQLLNIRALADEKKKCRWEVDNPNDPEL